MSYDKILVGVGFAEGDDANLTLAVHAEFAIGHAIEIARNSSASLTFAHSFPVSSKERAELEDDADTDGSVLSVDPEGDGSAGRTRCVGRA